MQLPDAVREEIETRAAAVGFAALQRASAALSEAYRTGNPAPPIPAAERLAAYLVTRMPATYAAAHAALAQVCAGMADQTVASLLDIGSGTGAASLAARHWFPGLSEFTLVERDSPSAEASAAWLPGAAVSIQDFRRVERFAAHDLVMAAYALGEIREAEALDVATRLWEAAGAALVAIEPGTPKGFGLIRKLRDRLLDAGAHMIAPCPAESACPIADPDWCHFAARVERSSLHRRMKGADLNYEDEKFSYVAFGKQPAALAEARIVRRPKHQPGLIVLETCRAGALETVRVGRRDKSAFRAVREARWGSAWK